MREYRRQGSARGRSGNWPFYLNRLQLMKVLNILLILYLFPVHCFANNYTVDASIDEFIVYENEPVLIEITLKSRQKNWIIDRSNRSSPFVSPLMAECNDETYDEFSTIIAVQVDGSGIKEIGPYEFKIGNEGVKTPPLKIYKIPRKSNPPEFELISKKDPNGSERYHIKIEYSATKEKLGVHVVEIDHENLPKGLQFKSGSSYIENGRVYCDFSVEKTSKGLISLSKINFIDIPNWIDFPSIPLE